MCRVRGLGEHQLLLFLVQFALLLGAARLLGGIARRFQQPSVVGEVLAGVLLGPAVLGRMLPGLHAAVFPKEGEQNDLLELLSWIGMILLMLRTGVDTDLGMLRSLKKAAILASVCGILIPFGTGLAVGNVVPAELVGRAGRTLFALFIATAMSISAVKVIAKILLDLSLMRRDIGFVILGASIFDDTIGWVVLAVIIRVAQTGQVGFEAAGLTLAATIGFVLMALILVRPVAGRAIRWLEREGRLEHGTTSAILVLTLACGAVTQALGIHAIFGAFVAGLIVGESPRIKEATLESIDSTVMGVFAPVFFAYSGLKVQVLELPGWQTTALVLGGAILGKVAGAGLGAKLGGMRTGEAAAVGVGLSARGSMELVVARIGMDLGVLAAPMYGLIVLIPILTSVTTPLLLRLSLRWIPVAGREARRLEAEAAEDRAFIKRRGTKILVSTSGEPYDQALQLAAPLARLPGATMVGMAVVPGRGPRRGTPSPAEQAGARAVRVAREFELPDFHTFVVPAERMEDALREEISRGYDLVFVSVTRARGPSQRLLQGLLDTGASDIVLVRTWEGVRRFRRILLPVTGAAPSRAAAELAFLYARETRARVQLVHVVDPTRVTDRRVRTEQRLVGARVLDELTRRGREEGVEVDCRLLSSRFPARAILDVAEEERTDLILLGAMPRYVEQRAYFGVTTDVVLAHAPCPVAIYVGGVRPPALRPAPVEGPPAPAMH